MNLKKRKYHDPKLLHNKTMEEKMIDGLPIPLIQATPFYNN